MALTYPIKIEFKDYPSGVWVDWSQYLAEAPTTNQRVESENEGEAGAIVFDEALVTFRYEPGNPVHHAFSIDLTDKQRYLFRISFHKSDKTYEQRMEGMADFSTIEWPENEQNVISFQIVDKLSALGILSAELSRTQYTLDSRVLVQQAGTDHVYYDLPVLESSNQMSISARDDQGNILPLSTPIIFPGELLLDPRSFINGTDPVYYVVLKSFIDISTNFINVYPEIQPRTEDLLIVQIGSGGNNYLGKELYGADINNIVNGELISLKGIETLRSLYNQAWPNDLLSVIPSNLDFSIPSEYAVRMTDESPLGENPLDALSTILNSIKPSGGILSGCYFYINKSGNPVIHARDNIASGTTRTLGTTKVIRRRKKYFWDKLVDGTNVNVKSWLLDSNGEYLEGNAVKTLKANGTTGFIKPKNELCKKIIAPFSEVPISTQEELDACALAVADEILQFYGRRRAAYEFELKLDDNTIQWELVDNITIGSAQYYFTAIEVDAISRTVSLEAVEIEGHEFDFRQIVVPLSEANSVNGSSGGSSSSGSSGSIIIEGNYTFIPPLLLTGAEVSIKNMALDAENILAQRAGNTAQEYRIYNRFLDNANNEFVSLGFKNNQNIFTFESEKNGSGLKRNTAFLGSNYFGFGTSDFTDTAAAGRVTIKGSSNNGVSNILVLRDSDEANVLTVDTAGNINIPATTLGSRKISLYHELDSDTETSSINFGHGVHTGASIIYGRFRPFELKTDWEDIIFKVNNGNFQQYIIPLMIKSTTGRVGINNAAPDWKLDVQLSYDDRLRIKQTEEYNFGIILTKSVNYGVYNNEWQIYQPAGTTDLRFYNVNDKITIKSNGDIALAGSIGTINYASQLTGWRITNTGSADFRYLCTDELHTKSFIADLEQALAGSQIICKSVAKVAADYTPPGVGIPGTRLIVESFAGYETAAVFQNGDLIRLRQFSRTSGNLTILDAWGNVTIDTNYGTSGFDPVTKTQAYIFTRNASVPGSASGEIKQGTLALDYGVSGNGFIESTAIDGAWGANSPYSQIVTWTSTPGSYTIHNRTGKLTGITDNDFGGALPGFGTYINGTAFIKGNIYVKASSQLALQSASIMIGNISSTANNAIKISQTGAPGTSGLFLYDGSANELLKFALNGDRHIAHWNFTENCFYNGDSSKALVLNVSGTNFINQTSGIGFEVYNPASPKVFIGNWAGNHLDWNITNSNKLTISGEIIGSVITGGVIQTASSGVRIVINEVDGPNTLKFYSASDRVLTIKPEFIGTNAGINIGKGYIHSADNSIPENVVQSSTLDYAILTFSKALTGGYEENILRSGQINLHNTADHTSIDLNSDGTISSYCDIKLNPEGKHILPVNDYDLTLGAPNKKYLQLFCSEIVAQNLVAQNVMATIGGRILVGQTNTVLVNFYAEQNTITVKYQFTGNLPIICYLEAVEGTTHRVEFIKIDSYDAPNAGGYRYNVTRNLDGTGANNWYPGDAVFNTGSTGSGFIDIYSVSSVKGGSQTGSSIVGNIRNSTTFNDYSEAWAIGNLAGLYGQSAGTFGVGLGKYIDNCSFMVITPTGGIQFKNRTSGSDNVIAQWAANGIITIGNTSSYHTHINTSSLQIKNGSVTNVNLNSSGLTIGDTSGVHINLTSSQLQFLKGTSPSITIDGTTGSILLGTTGAGQSNVYMSDGGVKLRNNTADKIVLDTTGNILIGQTGAGQSNVYISSGTIQLRNNISPVISLNSNGTGSFAGNITSSAIITGGVIQTATSGQRMRIDSDYLSYHNSSGLCIGGLHYNPMDSSGLQLSSIGQLSLVAANSDIYMDGRYINIQASILRSSLDIHLDNTDLGGKVYFGSALDTNLYRSAANTLKTDDNFICGGNILTNNIELLGIIKLSGSTLYLANGTSKYITLGAHGAGAPGDDSAGTKIILYGSAEDTSNAPRYSFGVASSELWYSSGGQHKWYTESSRNYTALMDLSATGMLNITGSYKVDGTQVVSNRVTGWAAASGNATRSAFVTSTVTTAQLAERVKALIDDLFTHGLIGS